MQIVHDNVEFLDDMPINVAIKSIPETPKHWHNSIEVLFVLKGKLNIAIETENYHLMEDDIILINSDQIHEVQNNDNVVVTLQLNPSYYKPWLETGTFFICNSAMYHNKMKFKELKRIIAKIIYIQYNDKEGNELLTLSYSYQLILNLIKNFRSSDSRDVNSVSKGLQRLGAIIQYLNDNYADNITLELVAEREYLSPSYLSHFFRKNIGVTFFSYLTGIRMNHAINDLLTTTQTIEQIAANNGFSNSRYFVDSFKKQFGMLPRQYRSKQKNGEDSKKEAADKITDSKNFFSLKRHDFLNKLGEYLDNDTTSEVVSQINTNSLKVIEVNSNSNIKTLNHTYRTFTGVGKASDLLKESIQTQLRMLQKDIGFHYIKFHGILDDSMMLYNEDNLGNPYLTFLYVDQIIDFLLSIHLKPLIQFSFMPKVLAKDPLRTVFHNPSIISEPKDNSKWAYLITNLTRHFIIRYGSAEVRSWLFSFWNIPFKSSVFSFDCDETGYELYRITRSCVKECDSLLKFGSPSLGTLGYDSTGYNDYFNYCRANNCFPDFYNFNCYPVKNPNNNDLPTLEDSNKKDNIILSENPDYMSNLLSLIKTSLSPYPSLPIYITEWAPTISHREWLNDTCYRSAYIIKNILENYDQMGSFGNWSLSDILEELPFDNDLFCGELGLFTKYGIKKPSYYAFLFLTKLMNYLVDYGPGYFITSNQEGDYVILLYNYVHISSLYAQGVLFNVTFIERYNAFTDPAPMEVDLLLSNVENSTYTCIEHYVNRDYGSAFDEWVRMGAEPLNTTEEIETLKGRSMPRINKSKIEVNNKKINYYAKLEPHEIRLIEVKKKRF